MYALEESHWWYEALHDLLLKSIAPERSKKTVLEIFDAGCGTGRACELMKGLGNISGCDSSELAVNFCTARGLTGIFRADLNTLEAGEDRFDVITSIDVLYHRGILDDSEVIRGFYRSLRPGGILVLQVPAYDWLKSSHDLAVHTARRYTSKKLASLLEAAGFHVEKITYRVSALFIPIAVYRLIRKMLTRISGAVGSDVVMPPAIINSLLRRIHLLENRLVLRHSLPFGLSVFAVARKPS